MKQYFLFVFICTFVPALVFLSVCGCRAKAESASPQIAPLSKRHDGTFARVESFEKARVPAEWRVEGGGALSLSSDHYKHGIRSLRWDWQAGSRIVVTEPQGLREAGASRRGGIKFWIYSEQAIDDVMEFRFGTANDIGRGAARYRISVGVNFTGWRAIWIQFRQDAANPAYSGSGSEPLEIMEIVAPTKASAGRFYFDIIDFEESIPERRSADYQVPYIIKNSDDGKGGMWARTYYHSTIEPRPVEREAVKPEEAEAFRIVMERLDHWILGSGRHEGELPVLLRRGALQSFIESGLRKYPELGITRNVKGDVVGAPLFASRSPHGPEFGYVSREIFLPLVYDYKINGNEESKDKVLELFDHFYEQGWAEGSGLGTLDHETNRNSGYFFAAYLMRDELAATGRLEREIASMRWFANFGKAYGVHGEHYLETNADEIRTRFLYNLMSVLMAEDSSEKVRDMYSLVRWMNQALKIAPGYAGTIKSDYMGFHHRGVYMNAYVPQALHAAAFMIYLLHDTPFALSDEAVHNVRSALLTLRLISHKYDVPTGLSGRFPTKQHALVDTIPAYAYLALASDPIDEEMAAAFMRLWNSRSQVLRTDLFAKADTVGSVEYLHTLGAVELMLDVAARGVEAETDPEGFWVKPTAALAVLRRDGWMAAAKGFSQYVFDFEGHAAEGYETGRKPRPGENVYGRYVSYGTLQLLTHGDPVNAIDSGYGMENGWDWNRWPGATTIHLPLSELAIEEGNVNTRNFSNQTFVGGVSSRGGQGVFAMQLRGTVFDPTFSFDKSLFFFGREIVALGSGIANRDLRNRTETTLFQSYITSRNAPIYVGGPAPITHFPYSLTVEDHRPVWLIDPYGNGYIIPDAKGLRVHKAQQTSRSHTGDRTTQGNFAAAWIDHGTAPTDGRYAYVVLPQTSPDEVETYVKTPQVEIVRHDGRAHVVRHLPSRSIGYAVFDETLELTAGAFRKASQPVLVYEKYDGDVLTFSIADPDLRLLKFPNQSMSERQAWQAGAEASLRVELNGQWTLAGDGDNSVALWHDHAGNTVLEFTVRDGATQEVVLAGSVPAFTDQPGETWPSEWTAPPFVTLTPAPVNEGGLLAGTVDLGLEDVSGGVLSHLAVELGEERLYAGDGLPETLDLDTTRFEDGRYVLSVTAVSTDGARVSYEMPVHIENWWMLEDPFREPRSGFFGVLYPPRTSAESAGWRYATDEKSMFWNDDSRKVRKENTTEYLIWDTPDLQRLELKVYSKAADIADVLRLEVTTDGECWHAIPYQTEVVDVSAAGWHLLSVTVGGPLQSSVSQLKLTLLAGEADPDDLQLGEVVLFGFKQ